MSKGLSLFILTLAGLSALFFVVAPLFVRLGVVARVSSGEQSASVFFTESAKPEVLKQTYAEAHGPRRKIRILLVPGHDDEYFGTQFRGVKESEMTLSLSNELGRLLTGDSEFEITKTRDSSGYASIFSSYFEQQVQEIEAFVALKKQIMNDLVSAGQVSKLETVEKVYHNKAPSPVATRLYGINKWANENQIDLVVHIHFNDYPRRQKSAPGEYSGFSIYVPEKQYSNARASRDVAASVSRQLETYYPQSNLPKEGNGVVEDQDLIAIGAFNTLDPASILVEYGYIYEPQFLEPAIRTKIINELAAQTYIGIRNFFENATTTFVGKYNTTLLPHTWIDLIEPGVKNHPSILSLQAALVLEGVYPPEEFGLRDCPLAGTFGRCTWRSLSMFQKKYGITETPGVLGEATRGKLNELYGN